MVNFQASTHVHDHKKYRVEEIDQYLISKALESMDTNILEIIMSSPNIDLSNIDLGQVFIQFLDSSNCISGTLDKEELYVINCSKIDLLLGYQGDMYFDPILFITELLENKRYLYSNNIKYYRERTYSIFEYFFEGLTMKRVMILKIMKLLSDRNEIDLMENIITFSNIRSILTKSDLSRFL